LRLINSLDFILSVLLKTASEQLIIIPSLQAVSDFFLLIQRTFPDFFLHSVLKIKVFIPFLKMGTKSGYVFSKLF
jgi:hypothetical protein